MKTRRLERALTIGLAACAVWASSACVRSRVGTSQTSPPVEVAAGDAPQAAQAAAPAAPAAASAALKDRTVGEPKTFGNLTVMPIFAASQVDVGPLTTLDAAMAKGQAVVREVGADNGDGPPANASNRRGQGQGHGGGGGPQVNTLVLENKGDVAIYVLAGTIVKGGNQDRQIGQDFVIEPKQTTPIDAFCVEHGRWTASREGQATGGKFTSSQQVVVTSKVRAAAQYKKNQSEVWDNVEKVNEAHHKSAQSGTLLATLDAPDVQKSRAELTQKVTALLATAAPNDKLVGFAYAVDGQVKGARWFASHKVFELFRGQLVSGAAVDALTAQAERGGAAPPASAPVKADAVVKFVSDVDSAKLSDKRENAGGTNEYRESPQAYGSKAFRKPSPAAATAPTPPAVPISEDYLIK